MSTKTQLKGTIGRIRYADGDFVIASLKTDSGDVTVKGEIPGCQPGLCYDMEVKATDHPVHGPGWEVISAVPDLPTSASAIASTLCTIDGIGPKVAERIVETFGEETITALIQDPDGAAKQIQGFSQKKARACSEMLKQRKDEYKALITVRTLLRTAPNHVVRKAVKEWRGHGAVVIKEDPYRLTELHGVGFKTADGVAMDIGIKADDPKRMIASVHHRVGEERSAGNTLHKVQAIVESSLSMLGLNNGYVEQVYDLMGNDDRFIVTDEHIQRTTDCQDEERIASWVSQRIGSLAPLGDMVPPDNLMGDQVEAYGLVQQNPKLFLLTGAPGTGKTFLVKSIFEAGQSESTVLCAPTGKAAKRVSELTGFPATTIHRLLKARPQSDGKWVFEHNATNPIEASRVIIDEFSMVDASLARKLFDAIAPSTGVLIVGDNHQLPSVGPGAVLRDLLADTPVPHYELTFIKRQNPGDIITTCHAIKDGFAPDKARMNLTDLFFKPTEGATGEELASLCLHSYIEGIPGMLNARFPGRYGDPDKPTFWEAMIRNIQILSPYREIGPTSCKELNKAIRVHLFDRNVLQQVEKLHFAVGERVIQLKNDYSREIFNGDIGTVVDIKKDREKKWQLQIDWDSNEDGDTEIPANANALDYAYCLTVHKSQGSDWPIVILPLVRGPFYGRQLLYTGISRAKAMCVMLGEFSSLTAIAANTTSAMRSTGLTDRIQTWDEDQGKPLDAPVEPAGAEVDHESASVLTSEGEVTY